jgi:DNA-binding Lrp family transcriptional regulator
VATSEDEAGQVQPVEKFCPKIMDIRDAVGLDEIDRQILDLALADCRLSNVEIARMVGSTETTVRRRISNMQKSGTIRNFSALLQLRKFGNFLKVIMNVKVRKRDMKGLAAELTRMNNVVSVYRTMGEDDMSVEIIFKDLTEFQSFMDGLQAREEIKSAEYLIVSESYRFCPWCGL